MAAPAGLMEEKTWRGRMGARTLRWSLLRSSLLLCLFSGESPLCLVLSHQVSPRFGPLAEPHSWSFLLLFLTVAATR